VEGLRIEIVFHGRFEYYEVPFALSDSVYGSTFFVATGFHGLHVLIGTTFLFVCFFFVCYLINLLAVNCGF